MIAMPDNEIIDRMLAAANSAVPMDPKRGRLQISREVIIMCLAAIRAYEECKADEPAQHP